MLDKGVGFYGKSSPASSKKRVSYLLSFPFPVEEIILGKTKDLVLRFLYKGGNPHSITRDISKEFRPIKRSSVIQHLKELEKLGLARKPEFDGRKYGTTWQITEKGRFIIEKGVGFPANSTHKRHLREMDLNTYPERGHAHKWKVKLDRKFKFNWEKILNERKIEWVPKGFAKTPRIILNGKKTWLGKNFINIWFPKGESFFHKDPTKSHNSAVQEFYLDMENLMEKLGIFFTYKFTCSREHMGNVLNPEAKYFVSKGKKIYVKDEEGYWFRIDNSENKYMEAEVEKDDEELTNSIGYQNFINSKKKNGWLTDSDFLKRINEMKSNIGEIALNINELSNSMKELSERNIQISQVLGQMSNNVVFVTKIVDEHLKREK